jgi:hypothetical protein
MRDRHEEDRSDACRAAVRAFRPRRVLPASLAASSLIAVGASVVAQVVSFRLGHPVLSMRLLHALTWNDPMLTAAGGAMVLAGLGLILAAVLPGRTGTAPLAGDDPRFVTGLRRASLRADLHATVLAIPGVESATVRLPGRLRSQLRIRAVTGFRGAGNLSELVGDAVRDRLEELDPVRVPEVAVRVLCREEGG